MTLYIKKHLQIIQNKRIIAFIQSFGSKIDLHSHLHFLLIEVGEDQKSQFHFKLNLTFSHVTIYHP